MREELISLMETLCGNCIPPFSLFFGGVGEYLWCLLSRGAWLYFKNSIIEVWKRKLQKVMGEKKNLVCDQLLISEAGPQFHSCHGYSFAANTKTLFFFISVMNKTPQNCTKPILCRHFEVWSAQCELTRGSTGCTWLTLCILCCSPQWKPRWGIQCLKSFANCQQQEQNSSCISQTHDWGDTRPFLGKPGTAELPDQSPSTSQSSCVPVECSPLTDTWPGFPRARDAPGFLIALQVHWSAAACKCRAH